MSGEKNKASGAPDPCQQHAGAGQNIVSYLRRRIQETMTDNMFIEKEKVAELLKRYDELKTIFDAAAVEALTGELEAAGRKGELDSPELGVFVMPELLEMKVMMDPDMSSLGPGATLREVIEDLKEQYIAEQNDERP